MPIEVAFFDADSIQAELDRDLPHGLRMLADALECGSLHGRLLSAMGVGGRARDESISVMVKLVVSAPVLSGRRIAVAGSLTNKVD